MMKDNALAGKVAFVAGGSSGINLGVAHGLAEAGAKIALISRSPDKIEAAAEGLRKAGHEAFGMAADVRDYAAVERALSEVKDRYGLIDIVLSGAAGNFIAPAASLSANGFKTVVDIDLLGTFNVFRASYGYIRKPGASLIAISAPQAEHPRMHQIHACAAKAGVNMVCKCMALEWGPEGVRVNSISPGPIDDTEGMTRLLPGGEAQDGFRRSIPLGIFGEKRDIADLAIFLSTGSARNITGTVIYSDGGWSLTGASGTAST